MIRKHKSSVATFFGIYLSVSLIVGLAIYGLNQARQAAVAKAESQGIELVSTDRLIPKDLPKPGTRRPNKNVLKPFPDESTLSNKGEPIVVQEETPLVQTTVNPDNIRESAPADSAQEAEIANMFPLPKIKPLNEIVGNWKAVPKRAYPSFVTIHTPVDFKVRQGANVVAQGKMPAGSSMIPIDLKGDTLLLSSSRISNMSVSLPVYETDFREKIEAKYNAFVSQQNKDVSARREAERKRRGMAAAHEKEMISYNDGKDPRFDILKASIRRGEAGFFQIESAAKWRWAGKESIDGEDIDTAYVVMVQESVFGTSESELKALIASQKKVIWIHVQTGEKL